MPEPNSYSYPRYLNAKQTVDERALNRRVWSRFLDELVERSTSPLRILEVGGGVGATLIRIVQALENRLGEPLHYTLIDREPANLETAKSSVRTWARDRGYSVSGETEQVWRDGPLSVRLQFVTADLFDVVNAEVQREYDAVVGQALFDLLDTEHALHQLSFCLGPEGLWYLPVHYDGVTAFEPPVNPDLDEQIERLYHESMVQHSGQEGGRNGEVSGRRLLTHLRTLGATLVAAGSSDWVVFARSEEGYPADEAYFLHHILHFVERELSGHPELASERFNAWLRRRRQQIENGELIYIAHQLDVLARMD